MVRIIFSKFTLVVLAYLFTLSPSHANDQYDILIGRFPGAVVLEGNCIPTPKNAAEQLKSCSALNITRENFSVKIHFDPKSPVLPGGGATLNTYAPPTLPQSYKFTDATGTEATFYLNNNCNGIPGVAPTDCKVLTTAFKLDGTSITITGPGQFDIPGTSGSPIKFNGTNDIAKTPDTQKKVPTTGAILDDTNHQVYYQAKCQHKYINSVATSENIHVASSVTVPSATTNTYDGSGNITATTSYALENCPSGMVIHNLEAFGGYAAGSVSCIVGGAAQYGETSAGVVLPVRSADCEISRDLGRCTIAQLSNNTCTPTVAIVPGANFYFDGVAQVLPGVDIKAVNGAVTAVTISGTLYGLVFASPDDEDFQNDINNFTARDIAVSLTASATYLKTNFYLRYRGSQACVFAQGPRPGEWRVSDAYPQNLNQVYDQPDGALAIDPLNQPKKRADNAIMPDTNNCIQAPPPAPVYSMPEWNSSISPICTHYDSSSSRFRFGNGTSRAFLGVVTECIEETLLKVFVADPNVKDQISFFAVMQGRIQGAIRALMAMYIIFFGYKLIIGKSVPKRSEWMWVFLKLALVMYFAIGTGMSQLLPDMLTVSKGLSLVMMQAGGDGVKESDGYVYCDFSDASKFNYPKDKEYMQLWDTIDCKISKYLGIGDNESFPDAPQVIFVGVLSIISSWFGIPIFIFSMLFLLMSVMLIVRVLYIYIMALAALVMLVYISPLVIPAVLFEMTKPIFSQWITQLMAFWLQPVILFGFLSIMFIFIDTAMFGGNHKFEPIRGTHAYSSSSTDNGTYAPAMKITNAAGALISSTNAECQDKTAAACQYQIVKNSRQVFPAASFSFKPDLYTVSFADGGVLLLAAVSKLLFIVFIAYCLVGSVENISARLVGAMGSGAIGYAGAAPVVGPRELMNAGTTAVSTAGSLGLRAGKGVGGLGWRAGTGAYRGVISGATGAYNKFSGQAEKARVAKGLEISQNVMKAGKEAVQVPKEVVQAPKEAVQPPKEVVQAPKEAVQAPKEAAQAPKEVAQSPSDPRKQGPTKFHVDRADETTVIAPNKYIMSSHEFLKNADAKSSDENIKAVVKDVSEVASRKGELMNSLRNRQDDGNLKPSQVKVQRKPVDGSGNNGGTNT